MTKDVAYKSKTPVFTTVTNYIKQNKKLLRLKYLNPKGKIRKIDQKIISFDYTSHDERKMAFLG